MTTRAHGVPRSLMNGDAVIATPRLMLREVHAGDAPFILRLMNEPSFYKNIGDKGIRNLADARGYIASGPVASYAQHGFGLYLVALKNDGNAIGTCGLLKRKTMQYPDIGFAYLPEYWSQGYAFEAAQAIIERAHRILGLRHLIAVTAPGNAASIRLLAKLGFDFARTLAVFGDAGESNLYALDIVPD